MEKLVTYNFSFCFDSYMDLDFMLPSTNSYIFYLTKGELEINGVKYTKNQIMGHPPLSFALKFKATKGASISGFRLPPNGLFRLGMKPKQGLLDLSGYFESGLEGVLTSPKKEALLIPFLNSKRLLPNTIVSNICEYVNLQGGDLKVKDLEQQFNCTNRHIQKLFKAQIGITVQTYIKNMKFLYALCYYNEKENWKDINYHHYSHFKRDWDLICQSEISEEKIQIASLFASFIIESQKLKS